MNRAELSAKLHVLCPNVYFQPPSTVQLKYPCIVYSLTGVTQRKAENTVYITMREYIVTYITTDPEPVSESGEGMIETFLKSFDYIRLQSHYTKENLYHDNFKLYY